MILVSCGHTFCFTCTQRLDETTSNVCCPQCHAPIIEPHAPNISIIQYIDAQRARTFLVPNCPVHPRVPSVLFSLKYKSYACDVCSKKAGFDTSSYLTIESAMGAVNAQLPVLVQQMRDQVKAIGRMQTQLDEAVRMLESEKSQTIDELTATFANFEQALQRRQDLVMRNVEHEVCYKTIQFCQLGSLCLYFKCHSSVPLFVFLKGHHQKKALTKSAREG